MPNILDLIFPPKCIFCENFGSLICDTCFKSFRYVGEFFSISGVALNAPNVCPPVFSYGEALSVNPNAFVLKVYSHFVYENKIRECIKFSKYSKRQFAVLREITKYAVQEMLSRKVVFPSAYVIPIPLSEEKQKSRGFNQAEIIASVFAKGYGLEVQNSILTRKKDTTAQHRLNREMRLKNMEGAFSVLDCVRGHNFILVDDICTTGATLIESARSFYAKGAREVVAFTLSRRL